MVTSVDVIIGLLSLTVILMTIYMIKIHTIKDKTFNAQLENHNLIAECRELKKSLLEIEDVLGKERDVNRNLLSQKKSSETRLGQISEHLVPFLAGCTHDPKSLHFLGNPIDYIAFNFDEGAITFLEVKSGNSKASKRQKTIKNLIKNGRVYYEEIRINEKGVKSKVSANTGQSIQFLTESNEDEDGKD